ncbi:hypothetical protein BGZ79_000280 [Entomortierella chlamydospora]|nr:hypothetical protein BGZ79_000280 [Entomortierella chlamydospora]
MLKGRWRSLTNLSVDIATEDDLLNAGLHISACVVLHNILTKPEIFDEDEAEMYLPPNADEDERGGVREPVADYLHYGGDVNQEAQEDSEDEDEAFAVNDPAQQRYILLPSKMLLLPMRLPARP